MTAILGYTKRTGNNSIGILCADDLEGHSKTKADKLTKLGGRFVLAVAGLEIVDWVIGGIIGYIDQFTPSSIPLNSIEDLEHALTSTFKYTLRRWRETNIYEGIDTQLDGHSILVVLDTKDNRLFFADLGRVWRSFETPEYHITLQSLEDSLYCFGVVTSNMYSILGGLTTTDENEAMNKIKSIMATFKNTHAGWVGDLGAVHVTVNGDNPTSRFTSCFPSYVELVENNITRHLSEKNH